MISKTSLGLTVPFEGGGYAVVSPSVTWPTLLPSAHATQGTSVPSQGQAQPPVFGLALSVVTP